MILETKNNRATVVSLAVILLFALSFIVASVLLIKKVNIIQKGVDYKVGCVGTAGKIEKQALLILQTLNDTNAVSKELINETNRLASSYPELKVVNDILINAKKLDLDNLSLIEVSVFQQQLFAIETICGEIIIDCRAKLGQDSQNLNMYWSYTHYVLIFACLLMIILVFIVLYVAKTKKRLLEEKSKNKFLFNNSINCIITCDENGDVLEFNKAAEALFGYTKEEAKVLDFKNLYQKETDIQLVSEKLTQHGVFAGEVINKRKDGSLFVCYLSANLIYDHDGKVIGSMGISRDITAEKEKEQQFQSIINNAQDIIYTVDLQGLFTFVNESGSKVMGYLHNELISKSFTELVHPDHKKKVLSFYHEQLINKVNQSYLEFKGITKEGNVVWLGQNVTSLFSPSNPDQLIGFQGVVRNINQRKEAEERLRKSEESFRVIVNTINDLFYLFDFRTDRFEYISPNTTEVLGVEQEFFKTGKSFFTEYLHKEDVKIAMKAEAQLLRGESYNIEYRVVSEGRIRWIHDRAFPILNELGKVVSYSGVSRDITAVKSANLIIEQQNEEISQSISYAKNIQKSTLLTTEEIYTFFPEAFIFFNPRDVLSGDFYIVDKFNSDHLGALTAFAVGDCTGHGVPGGMLSFLCNSLLREAFSDNRINSTSEVLEFVREKLVKLFRSNKEKHIHDGMDVALCALSEDKTTLYFSGANLAVLIIRDGDVFEIKGDRQHVGYNRNNIEFSTQIVDIHQGDLIYLFSDGYQDQFGGKSGKKYLKKRFKELLVRIYELPLQEQYNIMKLEFHNWKGVNGQVDDVTVMGVKV